MEIPLANSQKIILKVPLGIPLGIALDLFVAFISDSLRIMFWF